MIDQEKDGNRAIDGARLYVDIDIGRWIIQDAPFTKVHRSPNDQRAIRVGATGGVNAELATKVVGRIGRSPGNTGTVASTRRYLNLGEDTCLERATRVRHFEAGWPPKGMGATGRTFHVVGDITRNYKGCPPIGQLTRVAAGRAIHIADGLRNDVRWVALVRRLGWRCDCCP